jgi:hypothetical protein
VIYDNPVSFLLNMRGTFLAIIISFWTFVAAAQSPDALEDVADEYAEKADWAQAFVYYWEAFQKDSAQFERRFKLAMSAMNCYEDALAIRLFQGVYKSDQGKIHPESMYYLGKLYQRSGNYAMAEQTWKKFKKKVGKVDESVTSKERLDHALKEVNWAMMQTKDDSIIMSRYPWNSSKSEAQAYWKGDSIVLQQWNGLAWKNKLKIPTVDSLISVNESWEGRNILQVKTVKGWTIGVATNADGKQQLVQKGENGWSLIPVLNVNQARSTMPYLVELDGIMTLFFASDRSGGQGGWDIWISRWSDGWQTPFPAGKEINTMEDELLPTYLEGHLYFSSKGHMGFGEMDLFRVKGKPGNWQVAENLGIPINSCKNDMGIDMKNNQGETEWIIASARDNQGCCLDIWHWKMTSNKDSLEIPDSTQIWIKTIEQWLPLSLYFHNDEPNPRSLESTTQIKYGECLQSYLNQAPQYNKMLNNPMEWESFEDQYLSVPYGQLQKALPLMLNALQKGGVVTLQVRGFASPRAATDYNEKLTGRRIASLINEILAYQNGVFKPYYNQQFFVESLPFGERKSAKGVSDVLEDEKGSIYSKAAREERRIEILGIHCVSP